MRDWSNCSKLILYSSEDLTAATSRENRSGLCRRDQDIDQAVSGRVTQSSDRAPVPGYKLAVQKTVALCTPQPTGSRG